MKYHKTQDDLWLLTSERGKIQAVISDSFLQHEMNQTGTNAINTLQSLFSHAIKLQDTLDAMEMDDPSFLKYLDQLGKR